MTKYYHLVDTHEAMTALFKEVLDSGHVGLDVRTDTSNPMTCELVGLGLSPRPRMGYYIPLAHPAHSGLEMRDVLPWLKLVCTENWITTCFYDTVFSLIVLERHKIRVSEPIYDVLVTEHGLDNGRHNRFAPRDFPYIVKRALGYDFPEISAMTGTGKERIPYSEVSIDDAADYSAATADLTMRLYYAQKSIKPNNQLKHRGVDYPLLPVLKQMTLNGIQVDLDYLHHMKDGVENEVLALQARLDDLAGSPLSVYQYRRLSELLFDELKLTPGPGQVANQGGFFPTDKEHLLQIEDQHPIVGVILNLRQMHYALSHHLQPLATKTLRGRIHSQFRPITATTRIASFDLDLHNVIVEPVAGHLVRKAFVVPEGYVWVKADYSQIDLRVLADLIVRQFGDWRYAEIFLDGDDPHRMTASTIFNVSVEQVSDDQRRMAKAINFAIIYGMGVHGLQRKLSCSRDDAQAFYQTYMQAYPVKEWMECQKAIAERNGYVETPYYKSRRYVTPGDWRAALNHPIQGGTAEIMRVVMIKMQEILNDRSDLDTLMLLQVHDELDFQVPKHSLVEFVQILTKVMTKTFTLAIPLEIEVRVGDNWAELEPF